jgi:hypothetical protein
LECGSPAAAVLVRSHNSILRRANKLPAAFVSIDEIKKQIEENKSLRFGSAPLCNTFLQTYCPAGVAKQGESEFFCKMFAWSESEDGGISVFLESGRRRGMAKSSAGVFFFFVASCLCCLGLPPDAFPQQTLGGITGTVMDSSGGVLADASVTVV